MQDRRLAALFMQGLLSSGDNRDPGNIAKDAFKHVEAFNREHRRQREKKEKHKAERNAPESKITSK